MQLGHAVLARRSAGFHADRRAYQRPAGADHVCNGAQCVGPGDPVDARERAHEAIPVARDVRGGNARHGDAVCNEGEGEIGKTRNHAPHKALDPAPGDTGKHSGY